MPYTKVVQYGDFLEITTFEKNYVKENNYSRKPRKARSPQNFQRRVDNLHRTRRSFLRTVWANQHRGRATWLLTFTMLEVVSLSKSYAALSLFFKRLRKLGGPSFAYIAVPEFQTRGAVHFHALIWDLPEQFHNERFTRSLQHLWQRGFLDCSSTDGSSKLAGYLAKYMSKAMHDKRLGGQKAFVVSRNALRPVLYKFDEEVGQVAEYFAKNLTPCAIKDFDSYWLGKGRFTKYNL